MQWYAHYSHDISYGDKGFSGVAGLASYTLLWPHSDLWSAHSDAPPIHGWAYQWRVMYNINKLPRQPRGSTVPFEDANPVFALNSTNQPTYDAIIT